MATDENDAAYELAMSALYKEHSAEAIAEFKAARLRSFYLAAPAAAALAEARLLCPSHPSACVVFAAIAIEVGIKAVLLKPIVFGLLHSESVASLVTDLVIQHTGVDRFRDVRREIIEDAKTFGFGWIEIEEEIKPLK